MRGLEISRKYYNDFGRPMLEKLFPGYMRRIAAGLAGPGSECFGFDDEISRDHDFEPGFCLWLTDEDYEAVGQKIQNAIETLPNEYEGLKKAPVSAGGAKKYGVMKISDFFLPLTGSSGAPETDMQWLRIQDYYLACACNGEVFEDNPGLFTSEREKIKYNMPEDVRLKKIAGRVIFMAQSGQYNFGRCVKHGEYGAAAMAKNEFVKEAAHLCYLLNGEYAPFYKWILRGMENLNEFSYLRNPLEELAVAGVTAETADGIKMKIEEISGIFADYFRKNGLSSSPESFLEPHAYEINEKIKSDEIRNMHIMVG